MFENVPHRTLGKSGQSLVNKIKMASTYRSDLKTRSRILHFRTKLLLQLIKLELRKEKKEKKGTPRKEYFISLLFFSNFSNLSGHSGDQTSTSSGRATVRPPTFNPVLDMAHFIFAPKKTSNQVLNIRCRQEKKKQNSDDLFAVKLPSLMIFS